MITKKEKVVRLLDEIFCDVCGKSCRADENSDNESALLTASWGYDSMKDGWHYKIDLCERCFDDTIDYLRNKRSDEHYQSTKNNPNPFIKDP